MLVPCASHNLRYKLPSLLREGLGVSLLCLSFLSGSSTTCVTGHLDLANDNAGAGDEFEALEAEFADLDGLTEFEVGDVDIQTNGDGGVDTLKIEFVDAGSEHKNGNEIF